MWLRKNATFDCWNSINIHYIYEMWLYLLFIDINTTSFNIICFKIGFTGYSLVLSSLRALNIICKYTFSCYLTSLLFSLSFVSLWIFRLCIWLNNCIPSMQNRCSIIARIFNLDNIVILPEVVLCYGGLSCILLHI